MHYILENEINLILPQVPKKQKWGIITTLASTFIGLAYEGISSFLHQRCNRALHKAINTMDNKVNMQLYKLMQLDNSMLMYGIYNVETLEKLIHTVHNIYNMTSSHERLFVGQHSSSTFRLLCVHSLGLHHYSINLLLYLRIIQDKYIALYREINIPVVHICICYSNFGKRLSTKYFGNSIQIEGISQWSQKKTYKLLIQTTI